MTREHTLKPEASGNPGDSVRSTPVFLFQCLSVNLGKEKMQEAVPWIRKLSDGRVSSAYLLIECWAGHQ